MLQAWVVFGANLPVGTALDENSIRQNPTLGGPLVQRLDVGWPIEPPIRPLHDVTLNL